MTEIYVIGGNHHNTLGVIRSLGSEGVLPNVILVSNLEKPYVGFSKYIKELIIVPTDESAIKVLLSRKDKHSHAVVIACSDGASSEIDNHRDCLADVYALPGCRRQGHLTAMMDKSTMTELAKRIGFTTPKSWIVKKGSVHNDIGFPCIVKPMLSKEGSKSDIKVCDSNQELNDALSNGTCNKYQIQKFLDKDFEYQLIGLSLNNGETVIIPGVSRCIRPCPGTNTGFLHYENLDAVGVPLDSCKNFVKAVGYSGLFSIELLRGKDGKDYFMEMNFRNDGNSICVTKSGFNLPYFWYLANTGEDYQERLAKSTLTPIYVMPEFDDFRCFVLTRKIKLVQWISDVRRTDAFMEFDREDIMPFWILLKAFLLRGVKKIKNKIV